MQTMTLDAETKIVLAEELDDIALELAMPHEEIASNAALFKQIYTEIERLGDTAELYEFTELIPITAWVLDNIKRVKNQPARLEQQHEQGHYYAWIELLSTLLREQDTATQALLLTELHTALHQKTWSLSIDNMHLQRLFSALSDVPLADLDIDLSPPQANTASSHIDIDDEHETQYDLAWDDDIHPELLEAFLIETPDLVSETTALIRHLITGHFDKNVHQKAARLAHTIKGSSAVVGVNAITNFAHQLEYVLEHSLELTLPEAANECLLESADCLEALFDSLQTQTTPPSQYPRLLKQLKDWDKKLQQGEIGEVTEGLPANTPQTAQPDPKLTWSDDIHPELLEAYLSETPHHIKNISQQLRDLSYLSNNSQQTSFQNNTERKKAYQKAAILAHTLKGSSATVEITALMETGATLEAIFDAIIDIPNTPSLNKQQGELLIASADLLEALYDAMLAKTSLPATYQPLLTQLTTWQKQLEEPQASDITSMATATINSVKTVTSLVADEKTDKKEEQQEKAKKYQDAKQITAEIIAKQQANTTQNTPRNKALSFQLPPMRAIQPAVITPQNNAKSTIKTQQRVLNEATLRVPVSLIEKLLNFSNELITSNTQLAEYAQTLLEDKRDMHDRNERIRNLVDELESAVSRQSNLHTQHHAQQQVPSKFDDLEMDNYNDLHSISNLLAETTNDDHETSLALIKQFNVLKDHIAKQQKINKALNSNVLAMRMEPVTQITPRLERIVRETCRQTHKKANFIITGNDLALDTDVLKGLLDPLLHLLRNAVDHGIESPQQRQQNNKAETGEISLNFDQQGDQVLLTLKDDGVGMNAEAIYQTALKKGLVKPDNTLSEDEKLRLILQAGFSTRDKVSKISGRGVGMDVVNTAVNDLSGNLSLHSEHGVGTEIHIQVPLTLVAANALLVEISENILAIPSSAIEQIIYLEQGATQQKQEQLLIEFEQQKIPLLSLSTLLDWPTSFFKNTSAQAIIIVQQRDKRYAFYFDRMMNFQEIVLKTLKPWMNKTHGVNGVCLLQNGVVAPVLNLAELLTEIPQQAFNIQTITQHQTTATTKTSQRKRILVVDDSLSNRKALSLTIEPLGYDVSTAVDGADAITHLEQTMFDLVITDLEMPTINGLQLTEYIRSQQDIQHLPIVMVTSRSTQKHRTLASKAGVTDYLTKPVKKATLKACIETIFSENTKRDEIKKNIKQ